MTDVCGKLFNPSIPSNAEIIEKEFKHVNLCIYKTPSSTIDEKKVCENVKKASLIWCENCDIVLNVAGLGELKDTELGLADLSKQELENLTAEKIKSADEFLLNTTASKLVFGFKPVPCTTGPVITVYYIGGTRFESGQDGLANFDNANMRYTIILTDDARPEVLAHEVGHILFSNFHNGRDIGPGTDPNDPIHNLSTANLMHHTAPDAPVPMKNISYITGEQCRVANVHPLIQTKKFPTGFITKIYTYLINFTKLSVQYSDDGVGDDTLEARFNFSALINNSVTVSQQWVHSVDEDDENGNPYYPNMLLYAEIGELPTDTIHISVGGRDDDPDDEFPIVEQTFTIGDKWGANLPATGVHTLQSRKNSNIKYSVEFIITKIASRNNPPVNFDESNFCFKSE